MIKNWNISKVQISGGGDFDGVLFIDFEGDYADKSTGASEAHVPNNVGFILNTTTPIKGTSSGERGSNDYLFYGASVDWDFGVNPWTICFWFKKLDSNPITCISWQNSFQSDFRITNTSYIYSIYNDGGTYTTSRTEDNNPHHVALIRTTVTTVQLWEDGVLIDTYTLSGANSDHDRSGDAIVIGTGVLGDTIGAILFDDFRIFNGVAKDINDIYNV